MTLKLEIINIYSSDVGGKVSLYIPEDDHSVYFQFNFDVFNSASKEFYEFEAVCCTPAGLHDFSRFYKTNSLDSRGLIIYKQYCYKDLENDLNTILKQCIKNDDFMGVIARMQRHFVWEYEDIDKDPIDELVANAKK